MVTIGFSILSGVGAEQTIPTARFTDVTLKAGIHFKYVNAATGRKYYVETIGPGCGFLDYNNDGNLDIYLVNGAPLPGFKTERPIAGALYRNNGDGTFTDVTADAGVGAEGIYGMGVAAGDYDNDGNEDLYVTGYGRSALYHNNGDGTFTDATQKARVANTGLWGTSAAFFDYDNDGFLDLFVANYVTFDLNHNVFCGDAAKGIRSYCRPYEFRGAPSVLYHNERNGTFTDVTRRAGVFNPEGKALGVVAADLDNDGRVDLYVANDEVANFLYHNRGDGTFQDTAMFSGVAYDADGQTRAGMGVDIGDYNRDGRPDILVSNFSLEGATLYQNGGDTFDEVSFQSGLRKASFLFTGWGAKFFDYDNDGDQDIFIANGHPEDTVERFSSSVTYAEPKLLLENEGDHFVDVSRFSGDSLTSRSVSRGVAFGDLDNDGDIDILIANNNGSPVLLKNEGGNQNHWIKLRLMGRTSNRDAVGARVTVAAGKLLQSDQLRGGSSYLAAHDPRLQFGLGAQLHVDHIEIKWPSGKIQKISDVKADQILTIREP